MIDTRHLTAMLVGYDGPFFPTSVDELGRLLGKFKALNGQWLRNAVKDISGFERVARPTTSDGYTWYWSFEFVSGPGSMAVLLPWSQDWSRRYHTQPDRSIAVYTKDLDGATMEQILQVLIEAVECRLPTPVMATRSR